MWAVLTDADRPYQHSMSREYRTSCTRSANRGQKCRRRNGEVAVSRAAQCVAGGVGLGVCRAADVRRSGEQHAAMALRLGYQCQFCAQHGGNSQHRGAAQRLFRRQGLSVTMVPLMGTTHMVAALDSGDVDATGTASPYMIEAALKGSDAVAVIGGVANTIYSLIAKPDDPHHRRPERQARRDLGAARYDHAVDPDVARQRRVSRTAIIAPRRLSAAVNGLNVSPAERATPCRLGSPRTSSLCARASANLATPSRCCLACNSMSSPCAAPGRRRTRLSWWRSRAPSATHSAICATRPRATM